VITTLSAAFSSTVHGEAVKHLLQQKGQEDLCFALWRPSTGATRKTALLYRLVLPKLGERELHGNASFHPGYFQRALGEAIKDGAGLAFMHSHLGPGWQGMSPDDISAEHGHAAATLGATSLPLVGLTLGTDGAWSARFWPKTAPRTFEGKWCSTVRVIGDQLRITYMDALMPRPMLKEELRRTVSAWGESAQANLSRMRVGIVGAGSVGSLVAEALARMGIRHIVLIDFDIVELLNLDRLLHATKAHAVAKRRKVSVLAEALGKNATADGFVADKIPYSVTEEKGFRAALDCDVVFGCVDRPWGRSVLNHLAFAHLIPVIDGGIAVSVTKSGQLRTADWKAHTVTPGRRCLECLEQFDPGLVSVEKEGLLDDPEYIKGLPKEHAGRRNENVFGFSMHLAGMELQQFLSMVIAPQGIANVGQQTYHFVTGRLDTPEYKQCNDNCYHNTQVAAGDHSTITVTGKHPAAERIRRMIGK
jgi:molybdopterin/thiamine biosynthesis adenylyltransferase